MKLPELKRLSPSAPMLKLILSLFLLQSCYLSKYPLTPSKVSLGTYKIYAADGDYMGTAWAVDSNHVVTAGHICNRGGPYRLTRNMRYLPAEPVIWELGGDFYDLCVLKTNRSLDHWLIVSDQMPKVGDKVGYVGYPAGDYAEVEGVYLGDIDGEKHENDFAFSAPCAPGASGSPVYTSRGVWGVLVRRRTDGDSELVPAHTGSDGCVAISLDYLRKFLDNAGVDYTITPTLTDLDPEP